MSSVCVCVLETFHILPKNHTSVFHAKHNRWAVRSEVRAKRDSIKFSHHVVGLRVCVRKSISIVWLAQFPCWFFKTTQPHNNNKQDTRQWLIIRWGKFLCVFFFVLKGKSIEISRALSENGICTVEESSVQLPTFFLMIFAQIHTGFCFVLLLNSVVSFFDVLVI